jgi:xanthine dehydrogenase accessory factor
MQEIIQRLAETVNSERPAVYCRLVETRGSTPQKAGALMLVYPDGTQAGTLGGGCVEAEVKRLALAVLDKGQPEIARFQLDHDYGWDDGLICGGRMQILLEPLLADDTRTFYRRLAQQCLAGEAMTEAIVFTDESGERPVPSSVIFDEQQKVLASLRIPLDSPLIERLREPLRPLAQRPRAYAEQGVAYLPALERCRLIIVGGGHVGKAVADLAVDLDFDVWVVDDREEYVAESRFPRAQRRIGGTMSDVLPKLDINRDTYCLIVTRGHNHDEEALFHLAERGARYVGLIGSRRKIRMIFEDLLDQGISSDVLEQVHAPLGIHIGSQTVPEIAISICAELVSHRNCEGRVPGRPEKIEVPPVGLAKRE